MERVNLVDQRFGRLTVISDAGNDSRHKSIWLCSCVCGNQIIVANDSLKSGRTKSCGCYRKESTSKRLDYSRRKPHSRSTRLKMSAAKQGEKHWNWKGGVTPIKERERNSLSYKSWREEVFVRDSYTCQSCFSVGNRLNAHHIEAFNNNPELRTCVDNGLTLCEDCHFDFHHQFGRGDNNSTQLEIFLGG